KMTALLKKDSTVPPKAVLEAMEKRLETMKKNLAGQQVAVYPIHLAKGKAPGCTKRLIDAINNRGLFKAVAGTADPSLNVEGSHNEQRVLWGAAREFGKFIKKNPPRTDYALYLDYGVCGPEVKIPDGIKREASYVHLILCTKAGEVVMVDFQNSHHGDFKQIMPKTCQDCDRLALVRLAARLGK
ncbi:MAG: hypothetical protein JXM70_31215, partial [Pirellulales bacterium]|nr:hypothetical protein [Pirellulales bacterium]